MTNPEPNVQTLDEPDVEGRGTDEPDVEAHRLHEVEPRRDT
jgi:hypothetical protein